MKIKNGFVLREIVGETVVLPSGDELNLNIMITLNDTGRFLWERLTAGAEKEELVEALLKEYDVDRKTAAKSVDGFIAKLKENDFLEN